MIGMCRSAGVGLDAAGSFIAVDYRKLDVHEDQVRLARAMAAATPAAPSSASISS